MTASSVLKELHALGVEVLPAGENLLIRPASRVPPELKARLREHKPEILAALKSRPAASAPKGNPSGCKYDWVPGYRGLRLRCITHGHEQGSNTIFRTTYAGYDTLLEMFRLGYLSGSALDDAQRTH